MHTLPRPAKHNPSSGGLPTPAQPHSHTSRQVDVQHEAKAHEVVLHILLARLLVQLADEDAGPCRS